MAQRRMFAKTIIDSDAFLDMPLSTQALYFHLSMRADDDGFINNPKKIQRMVGASDDDLKLLCAKQFIFPFDNGVVVIKHWKIHNYIRSDRYTPTMYTEEKAMLNQNSSGEYTVKSIENQGVLPLGIPNDNQTDTVCMPDGYPGKDSISQFIDSIEKGNNLLHHQRAREEIRKTYGKFFGSNPTEFEVENVLRYMISLHKPFDEFSCSEDDLELLDIAFENAVKSGNKNIAYIEGIYNNLRKKGIKTSEDYWENEADRDMKAGRI